MKIEEQSYKRGEINHNIYTDKDKVQNHKSEV